MKNHNYKFFNDKNMDELEKLLVRFSQLVVEQRWIKEIDINPLIASPDGLLALDGRVVVFSENERGHPITLASLRSLSMRVATSATLAPPALMRRSRCAAS